MKKHKKAMIALLIVALFGMILACISSHPFVSRRCEVPEEYVAEIRAQSVGVYSKKVPLLPIYISTSVFSGTGLLYGSLFPVWNAWHVL